MRPLIRTQSPRPGLLLLSPGDILMAAPELRTGQEQKDLVMGGGGAEALVWLTHSGPAWDGKEGTCSECVWEN